MRHWVAMLACRVQIQLGRGGSRDTGWMAGRDHRSGSARGYQPGHTTEAGPAPQPRPAPPAPWEPPGGMRAGCNSSPHLSNYTFEQCSYKFGCHPPSQGWSVVGLPGLQTSRVAASALGQDPITSHVPYPPVAGTRSPICPGLIRVPEWHRVSRGAVGSRSGGGSGGPGLGGPRTPLVSSEYR